MVDQGQQLQVRLPDEVTLTLSVALIEGEYESKVANLQLKLQSLAPQTEKVSFLRRIFKW